ncbi:MAG TPA: alpha/beta hydrolase, partial [Dehalococcoidia bacterium]|nr:alpha/beta hydrolase [Dehalococcoidia bacterium]
MDGVPGEWIVPANAVFHRRLLYLHGGGYVMGSLNTHRHLSAAIAQATGCAVLTADYRLAPEHPYPAAVDDAFAAYCFLRETGSDGPGRGATPFIAGDSAGAGLAVAAMLTARDAGLPLPAAGILLSAWADLTIAGESYQTRREADPFVRKEGISQLAAMYLGDADP